LLRRNWRKPIGEILIEKKVLTRDQLDQALTLQKATFPSQKIGQILVKLGYANQKEIQLAHAEQLGMFLESGMDTD
jgi:type IV pilus assembly protein PilB